MRDKEVKDVCQGCSAEPGPSLTCTCPRGCPQSDLGSGVLAILVKKQNMKHSDLTMNREETICTSQPRPS